MTQPNAGDYVPLGRGTMPNATTPGSADGDRNSVEPRGTSIVAMQEDAWRQRAEAAGQAAEELKSCKLAVAQILSHNYFGNGCAEGTTVYEALRQALKGERGWAGELTQQITQLEDLASACRTAHQTLAAADGSNAAQVTVVAT